MENQVIEQESLEDRIAMLHKFKEEILLSSKIGLKEASYICTNILPNYHLNDDFVLGVVNQTYLLDLVNRVIEIKKSEIEMGKLYDPFTTEPQKDILYSADNEIKAYMCLRLLILERAVSNNQFPEIITN